MNDSNDHAPGFQPQVVTWAAGRPTKLVVGEKYYVRTCRNDYVGGLLSIDGPYSVTLGDAAWVAESGRLTAFLRDGTAPGMEVEPVGVVCCQWVDWSPWPHNLFPEQIPL